MDPDGKSMPMTHLHRIALSIPNTNRQVNTANNHIHRNNPNSTHATLPTTTNKQCHPPPTKSELQNPSPSPKPKPDQPRRNFDPQHGRTSSRAQSQDRKMQSQTQTQTQVRD